MHRHEIFANKAAIYYARQDLGQDARADCIAAWRALSAYLGAPCGRGLDIVGQHCAQVRLNRIWSWLRGEGAESACYNQRTRR